MTLMAETGSSGVDIGPADLIPPGEGRVVRVGQLSVAVFRTRQGRVFACQAACPHRGGPLAEGIVGGETLVCPLHDYGFNLVTGKALSPNSGPVRVYQAHVDGLGRLIIRL